MSRTPVAEQVAAIARLAAAEGVLRTQEGEEAVAGETYEAIQGLMEDLFATPGDNFYRVPGEWWETPFGAIVGKALFRIRRDELITLSQAAELLGVSLSAISQRIAKGQLQAFRDPDEANPTKARRVLRREVEALKH